MPPADRTVLIAYDGSEHADAAVDRAAELFPGARAAVVTVWNPIGDAGRAARVALPDDIIREACAALDEGARRGAQGVADQGAERAHAAGLDAAGEAVAADGSFWRALVDATDARDALAVVVGSRGMSPFKSAVLGSVSSGVVQHSRRPVVVVHRDGDAG